MALNDFSYSYSGWSYFYASDPPRVLAMGIPNHYILSLLLLTNFNRGEKQRDQKADNGCQGQEGVGIDYACMPVCL